MAEVADAAATSFHPSANLGERFVADDTLPRLLAQIKANAARSGVTFEQHSIGSSRAGREMFGLRIGDGLRSVSITAGAHSDEPIGPMTAIELANWLVSGSDAARDFTSSFTWFICPQVNPDGAEMNRSWFADPPDPVSYLKNVVREQPG